MKKQVRAEMTERLITVRRDQNLADAFRLMSENNIRHLAVLDENSDVCGVISDRDVQRGMTSRVDNREDLRIEGLSIRPGAMVSDYMTWPVRAIAAETDLAEAAKIMLNEKLSCLLVREGAEVSGIITTDDMLNALVHLS